MQVQKRHTTLFCSVQSSPPSQQRKAIGTELMTAITSWTHTAARALQAFAALLTPLVPDQVQSLFLSSTILFAGTPVSSQVHWIFFSGTEAK